MNLYDNHDITRHLMRIHGYTIKDIRAMIRYLYYFQRASVPDPQLLRKRRTKKTLATYVARMIDESTLHKETMGTNDFGMLRYIVARLSSKGLDFANLDSDLYADFRSMFTCRIVNDELLVTKDGTWVMCIDPEYLYLQQEDSEWYAAIDRSSDELVNELASLVAAMVTSSHQSDAMLLSPLSISPEARVTTRKDDEPTTVEEVQCKVCYSNKVAIVLTTCGHTFCCACVDRFGGKCGSCRATFGDSHRLNLYI